MEVEFKFDIGDIVELVLWEPDAKTLIDGPPRMIVIERCYQETTGGGNNHYVCRATNRSGRTELKLAHFFECELRASKPYPADKSAY